MHFHLILFYIFFIFLLNSHSIYFTFSVHFNVSLRSRTCIMICIQHRSVFSFSRFRVFHSNFGLFTLTWCIAFSYLPLSSADSQSKLDFTIDFSTSSDLMRGNFPVKKAQKEYRARVTAPDETEYRKIHNNH